MAKRTFSFLVVLLMCVVKIFAQANFSAVNPVNNVLYYSQKGKSVTSGYTYFPANIKKFDFKKKDPYVGNPGKAGFVFYKPVPANLYANCLTFFCRKELEIEKATSIPFRFRLGSLEYTDYLEGKPNAIRPNY